MNEYIFSVRLGDDKLRRKLDLVKDETVKVHGSSFHVALTRLGHKYDRHMLKNAVIRVVSVEPLGKGKCLSCGKKFNRNIWNLSSQYCDKYECRKVRDNDNILKEKLKEAKEKEEVKQ